MEKLSSIRDFFHQFISRVTGFQAMAFWFAYQLGEKRQNNTVNANLKKEIDDNLNAIENKYKSAQSIFKGIEKMLREAKIIEKCAPFIDAIIEELNNVSQQIIIIRNNSKKMKNPYLATDLVNIIQEYKKLDSHCLKIADIYKELKESSVLEK